MAFLKDTIKLTTGTALAQIFNVLSMPILARLFAPDDFGVAALFMSIIGFIGPIMCFSYELSIMLPKSHNEAAKLFWLCIILNIIVAFTIGFCLSIANLIFSFSLSIKGYFILIPFALLFHGLLMILSSWITRKRRFGSLSVSNVLRPSVANCLKIIAGFKGYLSSGVLIGGNLIGLGIQVLFLINQVLYYDKKAILIKFNLKNLLHLAIRYKKFFIYSSWSTFLNTLSQHAPVLMLSYFFNMKVTGYYVMARYILTLPSNIISNALSRVFFQKAANIYSENKIPSDLIKQVVFSIFAIGVLPCLMLMFFSKEIIIFILGPNWGETGVYLQILAPMNFIIFISSPIGKLYSIYEKQEIALILNVIRSIALISALYGGCITGSIILTILFYSFTAIIVRLVDFGWILMKSNINILNMLYIFTKYIFVALLLILPVFLISRYIEFNWLITSILLIESLGYYSVLYYRYSLPFFSTS